jgi:predicted nuclease of predicted toxin-antitoxin system
LKFIVDANLPPELARWLTSQGHEASHVQASGLASANDHVIWRHARLNNACIVTKDEDFVLLHALDREGPPAIWIRIGNASTAVLLRHLPPLWLAILSAIERGDKIVEVSP